MITNTDKVRFLESILKEYTADDGVVDGLNRYYSGLCVVANICSDNMDPLDHDTNELTTWFKDLVDEHICQRGGYNLDYLFVPYAAEPRIDWLKARINELRPSPMTLIRGYTGRLWNSIFK
jgi:hypothetical protein